MSIFRKAISLFVILDENESQQNPSQESTAATPSTTAGQKNSASESTALSSADISKFEKHFEQLFEQANLPGPDYFEFWKTMDTLEAHIPDETARIHAVFASLKIQGLTKSILIDTAGKYKEAILTDKANFESAVQKKADAEIAGRQANIQKLEKERVEKQQLIEKLQREINEAATQIQSMQTEIAEEQAKIENAQRGYLAACGAMVSKIEKDLERFQKIVE